jgi:phosphoglycolate phosphatase
MVAHLKKQGLKLGVCTNKHVSAATLILDHFFSKDTFPDFVADRPGTDFKRKPDPTEVLKLAARLGVQPEQVAYLGDTSVDMETATRAGFLPVGVLWGFRTKKNCCRAAPRSLKPTRRTFGKSNVRQVTAIKNSLPDKVPAGNYFFA